MDFLKNISFYKILGIEKSLVDKEKHKGLIYVIFNAHPNEVQETYITHANVALTASIYSFLASIFLLIHAIFPILYSRTGSKLIIKTNNILEQRVHKYEIPDSIG